MARRRAKILKNGRNAGSTGFLMLENYVFDCPAFRTMKVGPRALLLELIRRHNGSNNGSIALGVRAAAKLLEVSKDTASKYFGVLIERGFIAPARLGGFNMKDPQSRRSTEWRLTWIKTSCTAATKDFMAFGKKSAVPKIQSEGPEKLDANDDRDIDSPKKNDLLLNNPQFTGPKKPDTYTSSHRRGPFSGQLDRSPCAITWAAIRHAPQPIEQGPYPLSGGIIQAAPPPIPATARHTDHSA